MHRVCGRVGRARGKRDPRPWRWAVECCKTIFAAQNNNIDSQARIDSLTENSESAASVIACAKAAAFPKSRRQEEVINMPPRTKTPSTQVPAKLGRPTKYSAEWAERFCARIAEGRSVAEICARPDMPSQQSVYTWLRNDEDFLERYARAREAQADKFFKECIEIADAATQENCNVARLR